MHFGKAVIAQGGGPTAVINHSLAGIVSELNRIGSFDAVYGAVHGVKGVAGEQLVDLSSCSDAELRRAAATTGSALGSTRDKPDVHYCEQMFETIRAHDIRTFFYIGGNDSADTCRIVSQQAESAGFDLKVVHVPKTVDNDLLVNDHTPGFGSAAKFVSHAFAGANMDNRSLPGIYLAVVMGRDAGFLTASASLGFADHRDSPLLVYIPESPFETERFLEQVETTYARYGRCMIAVSEGIRGSDGTPVLAQLRSGLDRDPHGNYQLSGNGQLADSLAERIKGSIKAKVRADTFGYIQRSFAGAVSSVDAAEARAVGEAAVRFALEKDFRSGSAVIERTGEYSVSYGITSLESVARNTKSMAPELYDPITAKVTDAYISYATPLIDTLPVCSLLAGTPVPQILRKKSTL